MGTKKAKLLKERTQNHKTDRTHGQFGPRNIAKTKEEVGKATTIAIVESEEDRHTKGNGDGEISMQFKSENGEGSEGKRTAVSKSLLWTLRYDTEEWILKKKWGDYYSLEEVISIPPLTKLELTQT